MRIVFIVVLCSILSLISRDGVFASDTPNGGSYCGMVANAQLQNGDRFGGTIRQLRNGTLEGLWYHQTPKGDNFYIKKLDWVIAPESTEQGSASSPTGKFYKFGGTGTWNNVEGYSFRVISGASYKNNDREQYSIFIFGPDGECMYKTSGYVTDGNIKSIGSYCSPGADLDF